MCWNKRGDRCLRAGAEDEEGGDEVVEIDVARSVGVARIARVVAELEEIGRASCRERV